MKFDDCKAKLLGPQRWCMLSFSPKRVLHCTITFKLLNTVQDIVHELASYWSLPIWLPQVLQLSFCDAAIYASCTGNCNTYSYIMLQVRPILCE